MRRLHPGRAIRNRVTADPAACGVFVVFLVAGFAWLAHPWHPVEDLAITELMVREVGHRTPLFGPYSSLPFHHPGPALFYLLTPIYQLAGERSSALLATTIWFNGAVLALIVAVARRLGGHLLAIILTVWILLWSRANGAPLLLQPWNPYVGALPLVAVVLLTWATIEGRRWAFPLAVALTSWCIQAHIQFGPTTGALLVLALGWLIADGIRTRSTGGLGRLGRTVAIATGVGVTLWLPVIIDLIANGSDSNPSALWRFYTGQVETKPVPPVQKGDFLLVLKSQLSFHPSWSGGPRPYHLFVSPLGRMVPLALIPLALAVVAAVVRRAWPELRGMLVGGVALTASYVALHQVEGPNLSSWYLITIEGSSLALYAIALRSLLASATTLGAAAWDRVRPSGEATTRPAWAERLVPIAAVAVTVALAVGIVGGLHLRPDEEASARVAQRMLPKVERQIPAGRPVLLEARSGLGGWVQAALVLQLEKSGHQVFATTTSVDKFPRAISRRAPRNAVRFVVVTDPAPTATWVPGVRVVADRTFELAEGRAPLRVVVVRAPRKLAFLTVER